MPSTLRTEDPEAQAHKRRDVIRWLLRPLAEPAFLRLYLDRGSGKVLPIAMFESTFFALPIDAEHPKGARDDAWKVLDAWLAQEDASPISWYRTILEKLSANDTHIHGGDIHEDVKDLARGWALPELFDDSPKRGSEPIDSYYEIHCHVRGAVPYVDLWEGLISDERLRANLRTHTCEAGSWKKTWAELVEQATRLRLRFARLCPASEQALLRHLAANVLHCKRPTASIRYLAVCTALRRELLCQRRRTGLSYFVDAYDRYSKLQKSVGRAERQATRAFVRTILEKFASEGASAVELRPTLETRPTDLRRKLADILLGYFDHVYDRKRKREVPLLLGLVPSLFKQDGLKNEDHHTATTWQDQADLWLHQVRVLLDAIEESPALRHFIVGIDAAGKERGCPPRALAPAFDEIRRRTAHNALARVRAGRAISREWMKDVVDMKLDREDASAKALETLDQAHVAPIRLGVTVHAGEDFEDPMTGLRHIWESVNTIGLLPGDRVGHAIAAALDEEMLDRLLRRRAGARGSEVEKLDVHDADGYRIRKPRGTHLLDLAWAFKLLEQDKEEDKRRCMGALLAEAATGSFGHPAHPERLVRTLVENASAVRPFLPGVRFDDPKDMHPEDWIWVRVDAAWRQTFEVLRARVLRLLIQREIVIESCPTSNLVVANLDDPPLKILAKEAKEKGLRCAIATDDPGLLGAFPMDEFQRYLEDEDQDKKEQILEQLLAENRRVSFVRIL